jgi:RNA polymerase-binding transcription factor DksA
MASCPVCGGHIAPDGSCTKCNQYFPDLAKTAHLNPNQHSKSGLGPGTRELLDLLHMHIKMLAAKASIVLVPPPTETMLTSGDCADRADEQIQRYLCTAINKGYSNARQRQIDAARYAIDYILEHGNWPPCVRCGRRIEWAVLKRNPSKLCQKCNKELARQRHGKY